MDEEFHEAMGMKRKYSDTNPDPSTASKKEKPTVRESPNTPLLSSKINL